MENKKSYVSKYVYCIKDNSTGELYPDTHLFVLDNPVKALYSLCVFAGKLNDTDISLCIVGSFNSSNLEIEKLPIEVVSSFDDVINCLGEFDENVLISAGFSRKTFIHHYNIVISNINNFRRSLLSADEGVENE